jgi:outer membrane protein TolC
LRIRAEIEALLHARFIPTFESLGFTTPAEFARVAEAAYRSDADLIIGVGFETSNFLSHLKSYAKPTIIAFMLDNAIQGLPLPVDGQSGIANLSYVQSPFDIRRDLETFYQILPYRKVGFLLNGDSNQSSFDLQTYFNQMLAPIGANFDLFALGTDAEAVLSQIDESIDAVYLLPALEAEKQAALKTTLESLTKRGIPVFSLLSEPALDLGAYAAYGSEGNFARIPRRVAINALKILEGQAAETLPVAMDHYDENLIINVQAARTTGIYPSWDIIAKAVLMNVTLAEEDGRTLSLKSAIAEGLNNNLSIRVAEKDVGISEKDVRIAASNYLPQLDASAFMLDNATVNSSFGTRGRYNIQAGGSLSQLLLSEPALANVAIQKLLLSSQEAVFRQNQLDIVQDVAEAYLGILQATAVVRLRNENVAVTRQNLDIAKAKEQVGFSGKADVYRFESELAFDNVDLNNAQAQWRQARFMLNNLLNRPIKETFRLDDVELSDSISLILDERMFELIDNPADVERFADFLVHEAFQNLPELEQLAYSLKAQERSLRSQNRAFWLPSLALSGELTQPIEQYEVPEQTSIPGLDLSELGFQTQPQTSWNLAIGAQLPIFQGNSRRYQQQQTAVGILQLKDQQANLRNNLELQVRANMETAGASFSNVALSQEAVAASRKNFELAQNNYQQGLLNITSLIDAQNALLQAEINAINAEYTFINDILAVERSIGYFHFLALPQDQSEFFQRFAEFITKN